MKLHREILSRTVYSVAILLATAATLMTYVPSYADTDDRIEAAAKNSYVFKNYLKDDDVKVDSKDGTVTLTGTVNNESHKSLAQDTVSGLPGVKKVDNRLEVTGESAKNPDAWLATKVKSALMFHKNVSGLHTDVDVKDGVVTLRGDAENAAQKELTTQYAKEIEGVKDVKNEMTVAKNPKKTNESTGEKVDDASITAQVKMTLLFHKATSAVNTHVETDNGIVILKGKAQNNAERDLVTKLVEDVHGVKKVVNNMTVDVSKNN
jgi:hyperosmotically inducible protein